MKVAILALIVVLSLCVPSADLVESHLPGCNTEAHQFSGYLKVSATKELHYILVESADKWNKDPLLIWLNGGPGCSSLLGYIMENGPCVFDDGNYTIFNNPFSWNQRLNVLYIEGPAGVGFSWGQTTADFQHNDISSANDFLAALNSFYAKFPEFVGRDLYISGESYAGIYVPYFAQRIHQQNMNAQVLNQTKINLKGIAVGNAATNWKYDSEPTFFEVAYMHNIISKDTYNQWRDNYCFFSHAEILPSNWSMACEGALSEFYANIQKINIYDMYRLYDYDNDNVTTVKATIEGEQVEYQNGFTMSQYAPWLKRLVKDQEEQRLGYTAADMLNRDNVRKLLHIPSKVGKWEACSNLVGGLYQFQPEGSQYIYSMLKAAGIKILVYSGTTDLIVSTYGTSKWLNELGWKVNKPWHHWHVRDGTKQEVRQVAGFRKEYDGLIFQTITGVGHMAPQWK